METKPETFELHLVSLGSYFRPTKNDLVDLKQYFLDSENNLYSANLDTWEVDPRKGKHILKCADTSFNNQNEMVNSLRGMNGVKVTIKRKDYKFNDLIKYNFNFKVDVKVKDTRHLTVTTPDFYHMNHA